jgi:hypothetical protein
MEVFKKVEANPTYSVSNMGRVRNDLKQTFLKGEVMRNGYVCVKIRCNDGVRRNKTIHRLVAKAFLGDSELHVDHLNGDKQDNRLSNLEYVSNVENSNRYYSNGLPHYVGFRTDTKSGRYRYYRNGKSIYSSKDLESVLSFKYTYEANEGEYQISN